MDISPLRGYYAAHTPTLMGERGGSAVLVPLVRQDGEYCLLYEIRSAAVRQPGVTVIGEMDFIRIRAGSLLRPVLGEVDPATLAAMRPAPEEVADTFLLPLRELKAHPPEVYLYRQPVEAPDFPYADAGVPADYLWRPWRLEVPVYHGLPYHLWGITARITMDLLAHL